MNKQLLFEKQAKIANTIAHPLRAAIIDFLKDGEQCVCDIAKYVGSEGSNVSRHLSVIVNAGVLEYRKEGLKVIDKLKCPCILDFFDCVRFAALVAIFFMVHFLPLGNPKIRAAMQQSFRLLRWYARNYSLARVVPGLFIARASITFLSQASVMRYLRANANPLLAYAVPSIAGRIFSVSHPPPLWFWSGIILPNETTDIHL